MTETVGTLEGLIASDSYFNKLTCLGRDERQRQMIVVTLINRKDGLDLLMSSGSKGILSLWLQWRAREKKRKQCHALSVMVNVDCKVNGIYNHHGKKSLGMPGRGYLDCVN